MGLYMVLQDQHNSTLHKFSLGCEIDEVAKLGGRTLFFMVFQIICILYKDNVNLSVNVK